MDGVQDAGTGEDREQTHPNRAEPVEERGPQRGAGRFAPSPTSELHLGNLRTALLAWLFARAEGLRFVVRIEDLDRERVRAAPHVADHQLRDLAELGLDWDGEVVRQSERVDLYRECAGTLAGYECFCTRREIAQASSAPHDGQRAYPGTCSQLSEQQRAVLRASRHPAWRVRANGAQFTIHDRFAQTFSTRVDDFVLFRNDGQPSYNLAVVVDDAAQGVTQVTRGADLLSSSPRQAWLTNRLGAPIPEYAHVGLVRDSTGRRLAKRTRDLDLRAMHDLGMATAQVVRLLCASAGLPVCSTPRELLDAVRGTDMLQRAGLAQDWILGPDALPADALPAGALAQSVHSP